MKIGNGVRLVEVGLKVGNCVKQYWGMSGNSSSRRRKEEEGDCEKIGKSPSILTLAFHTCAITTMSSKSFLTGTEEGSKSIIACGV